MKAIIQKANKAVWKGRANKLLEHNMQLQLFMKKSLLDLESIHKLAVTELAKLRLVIMPGTQNALKKIAFLAGPYCEGAPGPEGVKDKNNEVVVSENFKVKENDNVNAGNKKGG